MRNTILHKLLPICLFVSLLFILAVHMWINIVHLGDQSALGQASARRGMQKTSRWVPWVNDLADHMLLIGPESPMPIYDSQLIAKLVSLKDLPHLRESLVLLFYYTDQGREVFDELINSQKATEPTMRALMRAMLVLDVEESMSGWPAAGEFDAEHERKWAKSIRDTDKAEEPLSDRVASLEKALTRKLSPQVSRLLVSHILLSSGDGSTARGGNADALRYLLSRKHYRARVLRLCGVMGKPYYSAHRDYLHSFLASDDVQPLTDRCLENWVRTLALHTDDIARVEDIIAGFQTVRNPEQEWPQESVRKAAEERLIKQYGRKKARKILSAGVRVDHNPELTRVCRQCVARMRYKDIADKHRFAYAVESVREGEHTQWRETVLLAARSQATQTLLALLEEFRKVFDQIEPRSKFSSAARTAAQRVNSSQRGYDKLAALLNRWLVSEQWVLVVVATDVIRDMEKDSSFIEPLLLQYHSLNNGNTYGEHSQTVREHFLWALSTYQKATVEDHIKETLSPEERARYQSELRELEKTLP